MNKWKMFGMGASFVGFIVTLVAGWAEEKRQDEVIEEKVNKALAEKGE